MAPKSIVDRVMQAFKNDEFISALGKAFGPKMEGIVSSLMQSINKTLNELGQHNSNLQNKVKNLKDEKIILKKRLVKVVERVEIIEREYRRSNVIIRELPEGSYFRENVIC